MPPPLTDVLSEPTARIYIGASEFKNAEFARIRPLAMADPDGWQRLPQEVFQENELVYSRDRAVVGREKDYVVLFTITTNSNPQNRYATAQVCAPIPVVDLRYFSDEKRRAVVTIDGLDLPPVGHEQFVFLLGDGKCVFPQMIFNQDDQCWIVAGTEDLDSLDVFDTDLDRPSKLHAFGGLHYALPGHAPLESAAIVNWQSDADCLGAALKFLRRHGDAPNGADTGTFTQRAIERLQTAIERGDLSSTGQSKNLALLRRLPGIVDKLRSGLATEAELDEVAADMFKLPSVVERLDAMVSAEKAARLASLEGSLRREAQDRVELEMRELSARNSALMVEIEEWVREEERLKDEVQRLAELRESKLEGVRQFLSSVTGKVAEGALELVKLIDVAKQVGFDLPSPKSSETTSSSAFPPWTEIPGSEASFVPVDELPKVLEAAASSANIPIETIASLDITLRAGSLPTLFGPDADYLLDIYAACVTGGQIYRMALDPSTLGPDDLWRHPATGRQTALRESWQRAVSTPDRAILLCIDNVDAATLSNWLPAFHALFRRHRPPNLMALLIERDDAATRQPQPQPSIRLSSGPFHRAGVLAIQREIPRPFAKHAITPPLLSLVDEDGREDALAAYNAQNDLGLHAARQWMDVYAAAKPWFLVNESLRRLPRALYLDERRQNGNGYA